MVLHNSDKIIVSRRTPEGAGSMSAATPKEMREWAGWGDYVDTQYTVASPFQPTPGVWINLPNNALSGPRAYEPSVGPLYEGGKIVGRLGDSLLITIEMIGFPQTGTATFIEQAIDIGGVIGQVFPTTFTFPRGQVSRAFSHTVGAYTLDTWTANGGTIMIKPSHPINIYNIRYVITRTSAG